MTIVPSIFNFSESALNHSFTITAQTTPSGYNPLTFLIDGENGVYYNTPNVYVTIDASMYLHVLEVWCLLIMWYLLCLQEIIISHVRVCQLHLTYLSRVFGLHFSIFTGSRDLIYPVAN